MSWLTVSNAFNRSTNIPKVNSPFSKNFLISHTKFKIAWCVAWFTGNPICLRKRRLFLVRWLRILLSVIFLITFENTGRIDTDLQFPWFAESPFCTSVWLLLFWDIPEKQILLCVFWRRLIMVILFHCFH